MGVGGWGVSNLLSHCCIGAVSAANQHHPLEVKDRRSAAAPADGFLSSADLIMAAWSDSVTFSLFGFYRAKICVEDKMFGKDTCII